MIRVQREDFDVGAEIRRLSQGRTDMGAIATFVGTVRDERQTLAALVLEHYPGMTERQLAALEAQALSRWPVGGISVIHRYGPLMPGENIVLVAVISPHRDAAFAACEFLMDKLKTEAPFWKLEQDDNGANWVEAKTDDDNRAQRWSQT